MTYTRHLASRVADELVITRLLRIPQKSVCLESLLTSVNSILMNDLTIMFTGSTSLSVQITSNVGTLPAAVPRCSG
jgi:hypothetical protein